MTEIKLEKDRHFTPQSLLKYLNSELSPKLAGKQLIYRGSQKMSWNLNDIHQYLLREALPDYLGKNKLNKVYVPFLDTTVIELIWL